MTLSTSRSIPHGASLPFAEVECARPQLRTASGERIWSWLGWAYAAYWLIFVVGAFTDRRELNWAGAVLIIGVLAWATLERLWVRVDSVVIASLAAAVIPLLNMA